MIPERPIGVTVEDQLDEARRLSASQYGFKVLFDEIAATSDNGLSFDEIGEAVRRQRQMTISSLIAITHAARVRAAKKDADNEFLIEVMTKRHAAYLTPDYQEGAAQAVRNVLNERVRLLEKFFRAHPQPIGPEPRPKA